jgi:hypothetical protein
MAVPKNHKQHNIHKTRTYNVEFGAGGEVHMYPHQTAGVAKGGTTGKVDRKDGGKFASGGPAGGHAPTAGLSVRATSGRTGRVVPGATKPGKRP